MGGSPLTQTKRKNSHINTFEAITTVVRYAAVPYMVIVTPAKLIAYVKMHNNTEKRI
jgi:hypothetical protein